MDQDCISMQQEVLEMASIGIRSVLYLIAIYGLKALKPKQTLVQPIGERKVLNSYLYICG